MDLIGLFADRISLALVELKNLKKQDNAFSTFRLLVVLGAIVFAYLGITTHNNWFGGLSVFLFLGFISLIIQHKRVREKIAYAKSWIGVNTDEINALKNDFSAFKDGKNFSDPSHDFSEDLDLFGIRSLFQRISRTVTSDGTDLLAARLKENQMVHIESKQAAVKELTPKLDFRHAFLAVGRVLEKESELKKKIKNWKDLKTTYSAILKPYFLWPLSLLFSGCVIILIFFGTLDQSKYLAIPFFLNLFLFSRELKKIKEDRAIIDSLAKSFAVRSKLIELIESEGFESEVLSGLKNQLKRRGLKASAALKKLGTILNRLDSMDNAFGAAILNGLMLYHLFEVRKMLEWKEEYLAELTSWLEAIAEFDYWISLAGYAHIHPDFNYAEIDENSEFAGTNIGHPFISEAQRVTNSLHFDGFQFVILTGSNMAGKSTFLRTIGVNLILTKLGLPACAERFKTRSYQLLSSMKPQDSLNGNESYFQAEVNRLRMLVDKMNAPVKSFVLLDEILRGTNSQDKREGTKAFLQKIKANNIIGVIATHDIEITDLTEREPAIYSNKFFESQLKNDELIFDYKLRNGVCQTPNASDLMRIKGII